MNENEKNIETCLAESILAEVASVPTDPQFRSLVEESFDPLQQQALQQTGWDAYEKVVWTHRPYTFTSQVKQMKSNIILLLRRLWRFPFGRGAIRSLSDMWAHYISRLQGNETYGIPSRLDQLTDLPSAPLLVADRKISGADCQDGTSLIRLLLDSTTAATITEITDDNEGWTMNRALSGFSGIKKLTIKGKGYLGNKWIANMSDLEELNIPNIQGQSAFGSGSDTANMPAGISNLAKLKELHAEGFSSIAFNGNGNQFSAAIAGCPMLKKAWLGKVTNTNYPGWGGTKWVIQYCEALEELHVAGVVETNCLVRSGQNANLILLEFTAEQTNSANLAWWSPTLDSSNLQQFLSNFRDVLFTRLAQRTSTTSLTLTLSPAVYKAVYGLDANYNVDPQALAQTASLADFGIATEDLNEIEIAAGITTATKYATWLDTYRGAIYWNVQHS